MLSIYVNINIIRKVAMKQSNMRFVHTTGGGGNCETLTGEARINCVINRTILNLFASEGAANIGKCKNYTKEYVRSYIRKNYHTIIKGMPF